MKRRKVLTAAGALAGAAVTGCGGGGEDGALGGDPSSQVAAYVLPATVVPKNAQWHVEVSFFTQRQCEVILQLGNDNARVDSNQVAYKNYSDGSSHRLNFSVIRCNGDSANTTFDQLTLLVREWPNPATVFNGVAAKVGRHDYNTQAFQYTVYNDWEVPEYEWKCRSTIDNSLLCRVRFFQLTGDDAYAFPSGQYIVPIANTSSHSNVFGNARTYPLHHGTGSRLVDHEVAVLKATNNADTICIPNPRETGHDELVPSYLAASDAEKPRLRHRFARHFDRFSKKMATTYPVNDSADHESFHLLGNEASRILGGKSLIDHLNATRDSVRSSIQSNVNQAGDALYTFCINRLPTVLPDTMPAQTRSLLETKTWDTSNSKACGGISAGVSLQIGASVTGSTPWPGIKPGLGFRVSWGLFRCGFQIKEGAKTTWSEYRATVDSLKANGGKVAFTGIIKGFNGDELHIKGTSIDIEIGVNVSIKDSGCRVDAIAIDPVFDLDTRTWLGERLAKAMTILTLGRAGHTPMDARTFPSPSALEGTVGDTATFSGQLADANPTVVSTGVREDLEPALAAVRKGSLGVRTWGTLEVSPLRIIMPNSDVNDPAIAFRGGYRYAGAGWQPGVKYIAGVGVYGQISTTAAAGSAFARVTVSMDVFAMFGTPGFMRAAGLPWEK